MEQGELLSARLVFGSDRTLREQSAELRWEVALTSLHNATPKN